MAQTNNQYVFLSYVSEDKKQVDKIKRVLESRGVTVWIDRDEILPGMRWKDAIRAAISNGACFIACFSEKYINRNITYMNEELVLALEQLRLRSITKPWFIPVMLSKCEIPEFEIGNGQTLGSLQYVSMFANEQEGFERIFKTLEGHIGIKLQDEIQQTLLQEFGRAFKNMGFEWHIFKNMGFEWHPASSSTFSGVVQVARKRQFNGCQLLFMIRDYRTDKIPTQSGNHIIELKSGEMEEISQTYSPVLLICVPDGHEKPKYAIIKRKNHHAPPRIVKIPKGNVFGPHIAKEIYAAVREWYGRERAFPRLDHANWPIMRVAHVKTDAREFYDSWRKDGCHSPYFGEVLITLRAWRHITARRRNQYDVIHRLQLLGAARAVLETFTAADVLRRGKKRVLYAQTATVRYSHRADAIITVVTERCGKGPVHFYGVYERLRE